MGNSKGYREHTRIRDGNLNSGIACGADFNGWSTCESTGSNSENKRPCDQRYFGPILCSDRMVNLLVASWSDDSSSIQSHRNQYKVNGSRSLLKSVKS